MLMTQPSTNPTDHTLSWLHLTGPGQHRAVVEGLNQITLLWTDSDLSIPIDWPVFDTEKDGKSKNDQLPQMFETARQGGLKPDGVLWD
ncbi:hypothetical protein CMK12_10725 [Candidatus Poribacteria bacterium]|nr:hypothetical protein [Candidatus Poribacteria bacterium]